MRRLFRLGILFLSVSIFVACDTFVEEVDQPRDTAGSESFTDDSEARFLLRGVQAQWADATDLTFTTADFLSDEFRFGLNGDATFPTFGQLDRGRPQEQNNSVDAALNAVGEYRFLADDLLERADDIEFTDEATASETELRYVGNLHGAIARFYYATYFGLNPREGGGTIDTSAFIPSPEMYDLAESKFSEALSYAQNLSGGFVDADRAQKIVQSVRARSALYAGTHDFDADGGLQGDDALQLAADYASEGLVPGDDPYEVGYTVQDPNEYADEAGRQRLQMVAQDGVLLNETVAESDAYRRDDQGSIIARSWILDVLLVNPNELARVPLASIRPGPSFTALTQDNVGSEIDLWLDFLSGDEEIGTAPFEFAQDKYGEDGALPFMSWQENHLIRAELELRGYSTGSESALELVNEVRSSFGLSDLSDVDLDQIAVERDRTLFAQGQRLPDQRRLDGAPWHLNEEVEGGTTWQWLPITRQERDNNPNL